ncbi:cytochrome P450 2D20-like isoform X2 [Mobula hypostoma]|uniref:cytochrome P450 2D20-like isoform X2 n=1 Tax=Mobula hypostoma TaxID=723540 RepID=UPI002FC32600
MQVLHESVCVERQDTAPFPPHPSLTDCAHFVYCPFALENMDILAFPQLLLNLFDRFTVLAMFCTVFCLVFDFMKRRKTCGNYPPGPRGFPFVGNILQVDLSNPHLSFAKLWKKYGDVVSLEFGWTNLVVLSGYKTLKEALVKKSEDFADRPNFPIYEKFFEQHGEGIVFAKYGDWWKQQRKFSLLNLKNFGLGKKSLELQIVEEAEFLIEGFESEQGRPFDPHFHLTYATSSIICSIVLGKRFDYSDEKFLRLLHMLEESFVLEGGFWGQAKNDPNTSFVETKMIMTVASLFAAGTETTSTTLSWGLLFMVLHPDVQSRVHEEIDRVIGKGRRPRLEDREKMPFTNAVIHETQRLGNILPISLPHQTYRDTTVMGYTIPKGTIIIPNISSALLDEDIWLTPHQFNPGHFLDSNGKFVKPEAFIPFSAGHRVCLGEQLAKTKLFIFFTSMLQRFTLFVPENEARPSYKEARFGITLRPLPYRLCVKAI